MQNHVPSIAQANQSSTLFEPVLKKMLSALAGRHGNEFLNSLVKELCIDLPFDIAFIGHWEDEQKTIIKTSALFGDGKLQNNFSYEVANTPCEIAVTTSVCCVSENAQAQYPKDKLLVDFDVQGYLGIAMRNSAGEIIGVIAGLSHQPLEQVPLLTGLLQVFAFRVASELERLTISQSLRDEILVNQAQLDSVPALMFIIDTQGRFLRWNNYFKSKFGYQGKDIKHKNVLLLTDENDHKRVKLELANVLASGSGIIYLTGITKDGEQVPLLATTRATQYEGKKVVVGVALDMTEQQGVEHNLLRSQGRLARKNSQLSFINTLAEKLHTSHSVTNIATEVVALLNKIHPGSLIFFTVVDEQAVNINLIATSGARHTTVDARRKVPIGQDGSPTGIALLSRKVEVFQEVEEDKRLTPAVQALIKEEKVTSGIVIPLIYQDEILGGITIGFRYNSNIRSDEVDFYQTIGSSISLALSNARQFEQMETLATQDTLTGLPNRNAFNKDCHQAIKDQANSERILGMALVDLDRFKEINDTLDHQIGDALLQQVGPRIIETLSSEEFSVYRLGGDEFGVLIKNQSNIEAMMECAKLIKKAIDEPFVVDGLNLDITSSIGVVTTRGDYRNAHEMLRCSELAMYHAKNQGSGISDYSTELDADTNQRFVIMSEMSEAIRQDHLVLHYQPKYDLATRKIIGCEALVRWQHKEFGLIPPAKFIPLVELTQLIHPLTYWVMKSAMTQLKKWQLEGIELDMAINLSTRNLADPDFINQLDLLIETYDIDPHRLEFEVTETALMSNLANASHQLAQLNQRGIKCSLDDYGTGYSSLSYIKNLPLDILKIDRSFISQLLSNDNDRVIAQSTIGLAHNLGMKVVAEGVEDKETLYELARQGCDFIQGYYVSHPLDAESFSKLFWDYVDK